MKRPTPWYRVPEAWLAIALLGAGVAAGIALAVVAVRLPDARIPDAPHARMTGS